MKYFIFSLLSFFTLSLSAQGSIDLAYDDLRMLDEINNYNSTDSYPWLSKDGLRLYFTQSDAKGEMIVCSKRESKQENFSKPVQVLREEYGILSATYSADELTVYYFKGEILYKATRTGLNAEFEQSVVIELQGHDGGFLSSPSVSPDENEIYCYYSSDHTAIVRFELVAENTYRKSEVLLETREPAPGQLSKDGLRYYVSLKKEDRHQLYFSKRESFEEPFVNWIAVETDEPISVLQPSVSDNNAIVFVDTKEDSWENNNLRLIQLKENQNEEFQAPVSVELSVSQEGEVDVTIISTIYPNPTTDVVYLEFPFETLEDGGVLFVYDAKGSVVILQELNSGQQKYSIDTSSLASGQYWVSVKINSKMSKTKALQVIR